jgi:predicted subunit of tRNA(5-methylaminomethyl-2-thiouridylate) methyltransferase
MVMYNNVVHDQAVAALTQQMVQLEVKDQTRRSDRFPLPSAGLAKEFELLGCTCNMSCVSCRVMYL